MGKKKSVTKEEFVEYCYNKAFSKMLVHIRELTLPKAMLIMKEEIDNFKIKN